ncbi:hypothetical protein PanWU01x14_190990 [Parasponia andersonii]|uniref:Uncharacterized protein n=1 Tax=Parasponia andersonii TaxID=3476 RepID=A0A2P5C1U4_PARAD|nr:hypothetical protein PanWU01x14_190990 [Parasponia andersonii]
MAFVFGDGAFASSSLSLPRSTFSHRRRQTVGAVSHQSSTCLELLMLDSPTVHVSLLSHIFLNSKHDRRGARFGHIAVLSGWLVLARAPTQKRIKCSVRVWSRGAVFHCIQSEDPLGLLTPTTVEVRIAVPRQQTLGSEDPWGF